MDEKNPYTRPGCLQVDEVFKVKGQVCPFLGHPFENIEQMLATFDRPDELYIVTYGPGVQALAHKRDREFIERKRILTDQLIAKTGKAYGELTMQEVLWVRKQLDKALLECN